jgi:hypothetical protein
VPTEITEVERVERLSCASMAWTATRYTPALLKVRLVEEPVKQHQPLAPPGPEAHRSQYNGPPSGSVTGKITVTVEPTDTESGGERLRVPLGGELALPPGVTVT